MSDKDFKVKNKLTIAGLTNSSGVLLVEGHTVDSHTNLATQYGGTGTTTSPSSGQILYSASGTTYAPTTLSSLVQGAKYQADAPSSPSVGDLWIESDSSSDTFDPNIIRRQSFTATAAQTVFTTSIAFIDGYEQVFFNGMLLLRTTDYTTSNSNTITLAAAAAVNDIVEVVTVTNLNSVDTYTQGEIDTALSAKLSTSTAASTYLTQSNASSTYLASSTAASTYLSQSNAATTYVPQTSYFVAGKNKIINGDFGVWQRGTSFNAGSNAYTADRWNTLTDKTSASVLTTQQAFTAGAAPVAGYEAQYFLRTVFPSGGSYCIQEQRVEDVRTFAGQTVTLSFWAKADASVAITPTLVQKFGGSADVETSGSTFTLTTSWVRYSTTVAIPSISGKTIGSGNYLAIRAMRAVTASGFTIDIWGVQLEAGNVATPFTTATGTVPGELAACQRYCYVIQGNATLATSFGTGYWNGATAVVGFISPKSKMRTTPTLVFSAASDLEALQVGVSWNAVSAVSLTSEANSDFAQFQVTTTGGTNGQAANIRLKALSTAYIGLVAEL